MTLKRSYDDVKRPGEMGEGKSLLFLTLVSFFSLPCTGLTAPCLIFIGMAHQKLKNSMTGASPHTTPINPPK